MHIVTDSLKQQSEIFPLATGSRRRLNRVGSAASIAGSELTTVGQRMVHRRLQLGKTQAQISAQVRLQTKSAQADAQRSLSRNTYCMYETGKYEPRLKQIEQIAAALGVSPGWLAFGTKDPADTAIDRISAVVPLSISFRWSGLELRTSGAAG